jgi:hypothetical protein
VVGTIVALVTGSFVLMKLPPNYFPDPVPQHIWSDRHPALRRRAAALRNAFGAVLLVIDVIVALPGVPGPGMLTMFFAVLVLDFPGKVRIVRWLVLTRVNRCRAVVAVRFIPSGPQRLPHPGARAHVGNRLQPHAVVDDLGADRRNDLPGICSTRLQVLTGHSWIGLLIVGFWWAAQHCALPLIPDWRFLFFRFLAFFFPESSF